MATIAEALASAVQQQQAGNLRQAEQLYRQVLAAQPRQVDALHLLGVVMHQLGDSDQAVELITHALRLRPDFADAHFNLGNIYRDRGQTQEAIASYDWAIRLRPDFAEAHFNMGNAQHQLGNLADAAACFRRAVSLRPKYVKALNNLGTVLMDQGRPEEAVECYQEILAFQPNYVSAHTNMGKALRDLGKLEEALAACRRSLELQPRTPEALNILGAALVDQGKLDEALAACHSSLELDPQNPEALNNLGAALVKQGKLDEALAACRKSLEFEPHMPAALNNLGAALSDQGMLDQALTHFGEAIAVRPNYAEARMNRAIVWLLAGNYQEGWPEYEWRWRTKAFVPRGFSQPEWDGTPLDGRTILVHAEQGLGDTLHFVRYLEDLGRQGGKVVFECSQSLHRLLAKFPGIDQLAAPGKALPPFDVHVPLLSLPFRLGMPDPKDWTWHPYLQADPVRIEQWQKELGSQSGFKVGINWQGNPQYSKDKQRSIPLSRFAPLAEIPGVRLISLQKGFGSEQLEAADAPKDIEPLASRLDEDGGAFMDTAAVLKSIDLLISPDTALAHLAGGLGVPVWLALSTVPNWPWRLAGDHTPWYPTTRLFRQQHPGNWDEVFQDIATELRKRV